MANYVKNGAGKSLYYSGSATSWLYADLSASKTFASGSYFYGSNGNDVISTSSGLAATLCGGTGDDFYYLNSAKTQVYEAANAGIDTIDTWFSYQLTNPNVENLVVHSANSYAFGNSLDNIITGGAGSQTLWGAAGNDVLTGGAGADTFIITGSSHDLITDFSADDKIRLAYYTFKTFDDVMANAKQVGSNVVITVNSGASVTLADTKLSSLNADQFDLNISKSGMKLTFNEDFDSLSLNNGSNGGTWDAKFWYDSDKGSHMAGDGSLNWYINPSYAPTSSVNPFSIKDGILTIEADKASADIAKITGQSYTSGLLTTYNSFSQKYGYFEIRADLPDDKGAWPAFWLLPKDGSWPPEIDVLEGVGGDKNSYFATGHTAETGSHTQQSTNVMTQSTEGYHTYGMLWTKDTITWYFDGTKVASMDTPDDMHKAMYLVVNQAVGGMGGTPSDSDFADGSQFNIDYIHAYQI